MQVLVAAAAGPCHEPTSGSKACPGDLSVRPGEPGAGAAVSVMLPAVAVLLGLPTPEGGRGLRPRSDPISRPLEEKRC